MHPSSLNYLDCPQRASIFSAGLVSSLYSIFHVLFNYIYTGKASLLHVSSLAFLSSSEPGAEFRIEARMDEEDNTYRLHTHFLTRTNKTTDILIPPESAGCTLLARISVHSALVCLCVFGWQCVCVCVCVCVCEEQPSVWVESWLSLFFIEIKH